MQIRFAIVAGACGIAACQWLVSDGDLFANDGTFVLSPASDAGDTPANLVVVGGALFFSLGATIQRVPIDGTSAPTLVRSLAAPPTSMAYDGARTMVYCDGTVGGFFVDDFTDANLDLGGAPAGCAAVAIDDASIGYASPAYDDAGNMVLSFVHARRDATGTNIFYGREAGVGYFGIALVDGVLVGAVDARIIREKFDAANGFCTLTVSNTSSARFQTFTDDTGATSLLFFGGAQGPTLRTTSASACCEAGSVCYEKTSVLVSDFRVQGAEVVFSAANEIRETPVSALPSTDARALVSLSTGGNIDELTADDQWVFFVSNNRIYRTARAPVTDH